MKQIPKRRLALIVLGTDPSKASAILTPDLRAAGKVLAAVGSGVGYVAEASRRASLAADHIAADRTAPVAHAGQRLVKGGAHSGVPTPAKPDWAWHPRSSKAHNVRYDWTGRPETSSVLDATAWTAEQFRRFPSPDASRASPMPCLALPEAKRKRGVRSKGKGRDARRASLRVDCALATAKAKAGL